MSPGEEGCLLQLECVCGPSDLVDVGRALRDAEALQLPVRCEAPNRGGQIEPRLARAVQQALLLLRRSAHACAIDSLHLLQHSAAGLLP